ncbi:hypothetical protein PtB15_10B666 [Puccinia triticina]|nr:hypothetical protein PtB15_10B666 [Puccinia triticina]
MLSAWSKPSFATVRQPSQGPTFRIKGGAAGSGYSLSRKPIQFDCLNQIHEVTKVPVSHKPPSSKQYYGSRSVSQSSSHPQHPAQTNSNQIGFRAYTDQLIPSTPSPPIFTYC